MSSERFVARQVSPADTRAPEHAHDDAHDAASAIDAAHIGAGLGLMATGGAFDAAGTRPGRYAQLFEPTDAVQLIVDVADGRVRDASVSAVKFYGWPRETLQSLELQDLATTMPSRWPELARTITSSASRRVSLDHRVASGEVRSVDVYGRRVIVDHQEVLHLFVRDASDRARADRLTRDAEEDERLIRTLHDVCTHAASTAHEFNSLLTVIAGSASFLRQDAALVGRAADDLEAIVRASARAEELTRDLLSTVRRALPRPQTVDIAERLQHATATIRQRLGPRVTVHLRPAAEPILAQLVSADLPDALWTLMDHAATAMSTGGDVSIATVLESRDEPHGRRQYAVLEVRTTGAPIDDATRRRVLETVRGSSQFRPNALSALTLGGQSFVSAESQTGVGTTFRLHFPAAQSAPFALSAPNIAAPATGATAPSRVRAVSPQSLSAQELSANRVSRVALCCGDPLLRDITRRMLHKLVVDALIVESGAEALAAMGRQPDVQWHVLTDLVGLRGAVTGTVDALRDQGATVIVLSGSDADVTQRRELDVRAVRRLEKPFTMNELHDALRTSHTRSPTPD